MNTPLQAQPVAAPHGCTVHGKRDERREYGMHGDAPPHVLGAAARLQAQVPRGYHHEALVRCLDEG
jgi:hypothetical protein